MTALRQEGVFPEVLHRKQCARSLASRRRQDWRIGQRKALLVQEVARRLDNLRANPQDRRLPRCTDPQVPVLHQEVDTMLLQRDREWRLLRHPLPHLYCLHVQFVPAGRAFVGAHSAAHRHARLLRQPFYRLENLGRHCGFRHNALNRPCAVAKDREQQLAAFAQIVEPSPQRYQLPVKAADPRDRGQRRIIRHRANLLVRHAPHFSAAKRYLAPRPYADSSKCPNAAFALSTTWAASPPSE